MLPEPNLGGNILGKWASWIPAWGGCSRGILGDLVEEWAREGDRGALVFNRGREQEKFYVGKLLGLLLKGEARAMDEHLKEGSQS